MASSLPPAAPSAEDIPLFAGYESAAPAELPPDLSADRRRTLRQTANIAAGIHPLTGGPLHPLASRHRNASAPKSDPFTCGSCYFRGGGQRHHDYTFPKCYHPGSLGAEEYERNGPPRLTHGAASDVRAWWPACPDYSPSDSLSDDAARYIPAVDA